MQACASAGEPLLSDGLKSPYLSGWSIVWDDKTKTPGRMLSCGADSFLFQDNTKKFKGLNELNLESTSRNFISGSADLIKANVSDLKLIESVRSGGKWYVNYQQNYQNIPVYGAFVGLTAKEDGKVISMGSEFQRGINLSTIPAISKEYALDTVKNLSREKNKFKSDASLVILPEDINTFTVNNRNLNNSRKDNYVLAWKVWFTSIQPLSDKIFFIDAKTGEIIAEQDASRNGSISGKVTGMAYQLKSDQNQTEVNFSHEFIKTNITFKSNAFYSGYSGISGIFYDSSMTTKNPVNLANTSSAFLSFMTQYDIETGWDFAYAEVSEDFGISWTRQKGIHTTEYFNPKAYAKGWIENTPGYTGESNGMKKEEIDLREYINKSILLRLNYTADQFLFEEGIYFDNITISTDKGILFFDDAEKNQSKWILSGFRIKEAVFEPANSISDKYGFYEINGVSGSVKITSELRGSYVDVNNMEYPDAIHEANAGAPGVHSWNWNESDKSYRNTESNLFYHVNKIHDYFSAFNFTGADFQIKALINHDSTCNAIYSGSLGTIEFGGGIGCENLALSSDAVYHEYTHAVIDTIFDLGDGNCRNDDINHSGDSMHEALADFFSCSLKNESLMNYEGAFARNLNNTRKYPDDWTGECHSDGMILSGALWGIRDVLGYKADALVFDALRIVPHPRNFPEFLDNLLLADDNNSDLMDGTPDKNLICLSFDEHGLYSASGQCDCLPRVLDYSGVDENKTVLIMWNNSCVSSSTSVFYCEPGFNCSFDDLGDAYSTPPDSGGPGVYNATIFLNKPGNWTFLIRTINNNFSYYSKIYKINISEDYFREISLNISLNSGWNMISIPVQMKNNSLEYVFSSLSGRYTDVFTYYDEWRFKKLYENEWFGELEEIEPEKGYWIKVSEDANLTISGTIIENASIDLHEGWNLIGWPSINPVKIDNLSIKGKYKSIHSYYPGWRFKMLYNNEWFGDLEETEPEKGYWINMNESMKLEI